MKYIKLFENFDSYDPYELMIIPPNKKAEMIMGEIIKNNPNLNLVNDLIALGANLDWQNEENFNRTPLHWAAWGGRVEIVRMLIDAGANVNVQDEWGNTPLHEATSLGRVEIAQMLIDARANVNVQDNDGGTPLHRAAEFGKTEIAQMLIDAKADLNVQAKNGRTALHGAAELERVEIVRMLIDAGARKAILDYRDRLPYDLADTQELKNLLRP